jgi:PTS system nitrogen regulatory IIA component
MKLADFLSRSAAMIDVHASDKRELLQEVARKVASILDIPSDQILAELLSRERLGSTGMGGGVAIPHAKSRSIRKPVGVLARLRSPIEFDAIDGRPVDLVFALLLPLQTKADQLGVLAAVARKLRTPEALSRLRAAKSASELYAAVAE